MTDKDFLRELLATFRTEAEEHLRDIVSNVVLLEQASKGANKDIVERLLRTLHTLKGAARAVNLSDLEYLCHAMESVFSAMRKHEYILASDQFDLVHQASNLGKLLCGEELSGRLRNQAAMLAERLEHLGTEIAAAGTIAAPVQVTAPPEAVPAAAEPASGLEAIEHTAAGGSEPPRSDIIRVQGRNLDAIRYQAEALLSIELGLQHHISELLMLADEIADELSHDEPAARQALRERQTIRTRTVARERNVRRPEQGMTASHGYDHRCRRLATSLSRTRQNFSQIRSRLMDATLDTALVPFSSALEHLPGLVRNLARSRDKTVTLNVQGDSIPIDRRVLDLIRDALIHLVTNAVDHGIENKETRLARGKPEAGTVQINILQRGSNKVEVVVADDGAGIDVEGVIDAARKGGHLTADQLAGLGARERLELALRAGVSTRDEVTHVSGRGVGLAVVAEKIVSVGGELSIENRDGVGCSFTLRIPVRLTTLRGLVLRSANSTYVLPLSGVEEVRSLKPGDIRTVNNRETLLVRGGVVPALRLEAVLGLQHLATSTDPDAAKAVIARAGSSTFALLVDEILSEQEVLPKSLGRQLRRVRCISGATELGDGSLVPILSLEDIANFGLAANGRAAPAGREEAGISTARRLLVVEDSITSRLLLKHILEGAGYQVSTAVDGLDALSRLRQEHFDAVVSDVEMPRMDGLALTQRIRDNPKTEEIPVILVTSLQSAEEKERGLRAGADAYVVKGSFDQDNLLKTISRLL